jgi:hypothetical protein
LQRGSFNGGVNFVIDRESLGSITADLVIENGDQSKPYRYIPMFARTSRRMCRRGLGRPGQPYRLRNARSSSCRYPGGASRSPGATPTASTGRPCASRSGSTTMTGAPRLDVGRQMDLRPRGTLRALAARPRPRAVVGHLLAARLRVARSFRLGPSPLPHGGPRARPALDDGGRVWHQVVPGQRQGAAPVGIATDGRRDVHVVSQRPVLDQPNCSPCRVDVRGSSRERTACAAVLAAIFAPQAKSTWSTRTRCNARGDSGSSP